MATKKTKADPQKIALTDPNKHSAISLAKKLKERKRLNESLLGDS